MDSLSQLALGAACSVAVMGRRTAVWKAALWGGIAGTLPDLDALIDFGDAVSNMTHHRAESHGLFFVTLAAPLLAWVANRVHGGDGLFRRWCVALWLALFTHPLLDALTIYGTQLLQPFSEHPYAVGLAVSSLYLTWSVLAQAHVEQIVRAQLAQQGQSGAAFFVTPTPFNTVAWRIVVMRDDGHAEGFYSFFDADRHIEFNAFASQRALAPQLGNNPALRRMAWFTHGFYSLREVQGRAILADLRMGQEPGYVFQFALAQRDGALWKTIKPEPIGYRGDVARALPWLWARIKGHDVPPPR
jgi:inner membrane protein